MSTELTLATPLPTAAAQPSPKTDGKGPDLGRWVALGTVAIAGLATAGFWIAVIVWVGRYLA